MTFASKRSRWPQDVALALALAAALAFGPSPFGAILCAAGAVVLVWGVLTIHFPSKVELDEDAVAFHGYGRSHVYAWRDVTRVRVRRFVTKDRVLVRMAPASPWRGRYWLTDALDGYDELVRELERRAERSAAPPDADPRAA
jgi:hypothetical protein